MTPDPFGRVDRPGGALLDRQAVVKLLNKNDHSVIWRTTEDKSVATFEDVPFGTYDIEVSAVGYLSAQQELRADRALHSYHLTDQAGSERDRVKSPWRFAVTFQGAQTN